MLQELRLMQMDWYLEHTQRRAAAEFPGCLALLTGFLGVWLCRQGPVVTSR